MTAAAVPYLCLSGNPFEVGFGHGAARADALTAFIHDDLCRINKLVPAAVTLAGLRPLLAEYAAAITAATPALGLEIAGLADGAGVPLDVAVLLQARREIIGYQKIPARGDCTTYASLVAGPSQSPVLAQTVDLNGNLDDQIAVLDISLSGSARRALVVSFGGLLGYLGINSDGLAIGLNLVLGGAWHPGLPPYLAIRHLLDNAGCVAEAVEILNGLPLASSRSLTLCDRTAVACVEILGDQSRVIAGSSGGTEQSTHTNHYLHPDFASADELNIFARNSSLLRLKACQSALAEASRGIGVEDHFALLSQSAICVGDTGDIRRERTVAAVVMLPERRELHLRPGDPSHSSTQIFRMPPP